MPINELPPPSPLQTPRRNHRTITETGWHRHAHDYVVVVLTAGKLMQETANGEIVTELAMGQSYARNVGVEQKILWMT